MKTYPEILRDLREDRDYTQAQIAEVLGTTQQVYSVMKTASTKCRYGTCAGYANFTRSVQISFWAFLPFRNKSGNFFCCEYRFSRSPLGLRFCLLEHIS